jgi:hypothetical protein
MFILCNDAVLQDTIQPTVAYHAHLFNALSTSTCALSMAMTLSKMQLPPLEPLFTLFQTDTCLVTRQLLSKVIQRICQYPLLLQSIQSILMTTYPFMAYAYEQLVSSLQAHIRHLNATKESMERACKTAELVRRTHPSGVEAYGPLLHGHVMQASVSPHLKQGYFGVFLFQHALLLLTPSTSFRRRYRVYKLILLDDVVHAHHAPNNSCITLHSNGTCIRLYFCTRAQARQWAFHLVKPSTQRSLSMVQPSTPSATLRPKAKTLHDSPTYTYDHILKAFQDILFH